MALMALGLAFLPQSVSAEAPRAQSPLPGASQPQSKPSPDAGAPSQSQPSQAPKPDRTALPKPSSIKTAAQKAKVLADLHERLFAADSSDAAEVVADTIEQMWLYSGSETSNLVMERALEALHGKNPELALKLLDGVVTLQPAYAEAWNRRAYVHFSQKDYGRAMADLRHVLALEPRHFKAINGLATILREFGEKRGALKAFRKLLDIHPFATDAQQAVKELEREVEGQSL